MRETPIGSRIGPYANLGLLVPSGAGNGGVAAWLFPKQIVEGGLGLLDFSSVLRNISPFLGLKVVTEICLILLAHLLRRRLLTVLCLGSVVLDAQLADVELGVARLAHVETAKREAQRGKRDAAAPAGQGVRHEVSLAMNVALWARVQ
jgi:hypothetical protein